MPAQIRVFFVFLSVLALLLFKTSAASAHCHRLSDPTGDSNSSFAFADIVATELSDAGDSIGVKITTSGNIPDGFGNTGEMGFFLVLPSMLLSGDSTDDGVNLVSVHWTKGANVWEGSQFLYRGGDVTPRPWNASLTLEGKTASFKVPKEIIGKGTLAYQVWVVFISEEGESADYVPSKSVFSDCYVETSVSSTSTPQAVSGGETFSPSPQAVVTEGPKKEGNKIIERPNVVRTTGSDVGESFVAKASLSPTPALLQLYSTPALAVGEEAEKPASLLADLAVIAVVGVAVIGGVYLLFYRKPGAILPISLAPPKPGGPRRQPRPSDIFDLWWQFFRRFPWFFLPGKGAGGRGGGGGGGQQGQPCVDGAKRNNWFRTCKFVFLDPNKEVKIETDQWFEGTSHDAAQMEEWLGFAQPGRKGQTKNTRYQPWWFKASDAANILHTDHNARGGDHKKARQFKIVYLEIPVQILTNFCRGWEECVNLQWVEKLDVKHTYTFGTIEIDAKRDRKYDLAGVTLEDFAKWLKEFIEKNLADPGYVKEHPCDC